MQAPEAEKRSPWALRLGLAGGLLLLLGVVVVSSQSGAVSASMDPRELNQGTFSGEGTFETGSLNDTCYRFYQLADEEAMSVELFRVEGFSAVGETLEENNCLLDFQPMTADAANLREVASWTLNGSQKYALVVTCEADCTESTGYLMSVNEMQSALFGSTWLMVGVSFCCLGIITAPVALIIYVASKPSKAPRVMMVGSDGNLIPITDLNPDHPTFFEQPDPKLSTPPRQTVAPPFADTTEQTQSETYVDGLPEVAAGTMLTTEQVYALMRGDVEGAQERAKTQRTTPTKNAEDLVQEAASAALIASWDEGVPLAGPTEPVTNEAPQVKKKSTKQPEQATGAWKDWDEQ
jgi:hypothetical protein